MIKGLILIALLVIVLVAAFYAVAALSHKAKLRNDRKAKWEVKEFDKPDCTEIYLIKGKVEPVTEFIGRSLFKDEDYTDRKMELVDEAASKAYERNSTAKMLESVND